VSPAARFRLLGFRDPARAAAAWERLAADPLARRPLGKIRAHLLRACGRCADPDRALVNFERLVAALPNAAILYRYLAAAPQRLDLLVTIFAHSQALADTLTRDAKFFHFLIAPHVLARPREKVALEAELRRLLAGWRAAEDRYNVVRHFRRREMLRIGARDLMGLATVEETTRELSDLADVCLQAVYAVAVETLAQRYRVTPPGGFAVIGLGKLGGQELNYSSDVDVMFVYREEGECSPRLSFHEFYTKLAEEFIRQVSTPGAEGAIYRIDLRLRPEGKSGPLVRSLESFENYYAEWGETWERMALTKARWVAGDAAVGAAFVAMVQPFVYARHAGENVILQMAALKERIEKEVVREGNLTRHVKLGIGGIREIEFICQSFQVLRGARVAELRQTQTLRSLPLLAKHKLLTESEARGLAEAYRFLRKVEHRLQMELELQTHTIPDEEHALYRLARAMGFKTVAAFEAAQARHTACVRQVYQGILAGAAAAPAAEVHVAELIRPVGFADPVAAEKIIENLWHGPGFVHVSGRTQEIFSRLLPSLARELGKVADPDAALGRFDRFVARYGSRGLLYEILTRYPRLLEMVVRVSDASRFLAETLAQRPELFDEVCRGAAFNEAPSVAAMVAALESEPGEPAAATREWKRAELFRIGVEDVMGLVDLEQVHQSISRLAEACLRFGLACVQRDLKQTKLPFAVVAMGKFGGQELGYGADLDVLFVGEGEAAIRVATELIRFMEQPTAAGMLFRLDARLRPDGEKGPLVAGLEAHREYYWKRALLWERQALTKARYVAGTPSLGEAFLAMVHEAVYGRPWSEADWAEIRRMRQRIEKERGNPQRPELEFKTGPGGLLDVEFLVQALQLRHGAEHRALRTAHTLAALNRLTAVGVLEDRVSYGLRKNYLFLRRVESVLRREENASLSALPGDEFRLKCLAKRLGFSQGEALLAECRRVMQSNRAIYNRVMGYEPGQ
jgi:glutamate-ammonia-ligase adenylyltransferase